MTLTGDLRHKVSIESATITRDQFGGQVETWAEVAEVWAAVEPLTGREFLDGRRQETELDIRFRIRYRSGVVPGMRLTWGSRIFDIQSVIEVDSRRTELRLWCRELGLDR